jgi:hypothetical protein
VNGAASQAKSNTRKWSIRFLAYYNIHDAHVVIGSKEHEAQLEQVSNGTIIHVPETSSNAEIIVKIGLKPVLDVGVPEAHIYSIVRDSQVNFGLKNAIWTAVKADVPRVGKISRLHALDMDKNLLDAVLEYLLSNPKS